MDLGLDWRVIEKKQEEINKVSDLPVHQRKRFNWLIDAIIESLKEQAYLNLEKERTKP